MTPPPSAPDPDPRRPPGTDAAGAQLTAGLKRLASDDGKTGWHLGSRIRNAFLTGLVIVGPVTITLWIMWGVIHWIDAWIKPLLPTTFNPDTYLPFPVPGLGPRHCGRRTNPDRRARCEPSRPHARFVGRTDAVADPDCSQCLWRVEADL